MVRVQYSRPDIHAADLPQERSEIIDDARMLSDYLYAVLVPFSVTVDATEWLFRAHATEGMIDFTLGRGTALGDVELLIADRPVSDLAVPARGGVDIFCAPLSSFRDQLRTEVREKCAQVRRGSPGGSQA